MKPAGAPAKARVSPAKVKALRMKAGLPEGEMYKKSTPRDIVSSVVQAHEHKNLIERIRDGFGNVSSRNIM
jgi:hypothetical protein